MAEIKNPNLPSYLLQGTLVAARQLEVPDADFAGGMNMGGSNASGIGVATAIVDPKAGDWPRIADTGPHTSQHISEANVPLQLVQGADINDNVAFVQNTTGAAVPPGGELDVATGAVNLSDETVQPASWMWGGIPVA